MQWTAWVLDTSMWWHYHAVDCRDSLNTGYKCALQRLHHTHIGEWLKEWSQCQQYYQDDHRGDDPHQLRVRNQWTLSLCASSVAGVQGTMLKCTPYTMHYTSNPYWRSVQLYSISWIIHIHVYTYVHVHVHMYNHKCITYTVYMHNKISLWFVQEQKVSLDTAIILIILIIIIILLLLLLMIAFVYMYIMCIYIHCTVIYILESSHQILPALWSERDYLKRWSNWTGNQQYS